MKRIIKYNIFNENVSPEIDDILDKINSDGISSLSDDDLFELDNYGKTADEKLNDKTYLMTLIRNFVKKSQHGLMEFDSSEESEQIILSKSDNNIKYITTLEDNSVTVVEYSRDDDDDDYNSFVDEYELEYSELSLDTLIDIRIHINNKI